MNPMEREQMLSLLTSAMKRAGTESSNAEQGYWYPLSLPTYGPEEVLDAVDAMASFRTSMSERTRQFEAEFARFNESKACTMVNSGSSADLLLSFLLTNPLKPLVPAGSEILVPVVTWPTHAWSPMMAGLKVRFVDVNPFTLNLDLDKLEEAIGPQTRAIFVVHLMGSACDMDRVLDIARRHNMLVLEDCCEALGARWRGRSVGSFGIGGAYSFFFSHHIVTMEGGAVVVNDDELADHMRALRAHGWVRNVTSGRFDVSSFDVDPRYAFVNWGFNLRPTELQAAFGLRQLARLPGFNQRRNVLAERFFRVIARTPWIAHPQVPTGGEPAWFALPMVVQPGAPFNRREFVKYLEAHGVETRPLVAGNLARHPVARLFEESFRGSFPGADLLHDRGLYIGLSPVTSDQDFDRLISIVEDFLRRFA